MTKRNIPLSEFLGISRNESGKLFLPISDNIKNHLGTVHAAAQFALAELASGKYLEDIFPEYKNNKSLGNSYERLDRQDSQG